MGDWVCLRSGYSWLRLVMSGYKQFQVVEGENWGKEADFQITNRPEVQEVCFRGKALERIFNEVVQEINLVIHRDPFATPYQK